MSYAVGIDLKMTQNITAQMERIMPMLREVNAQLDRMSVELQRINMISAEGGLTSFAKTLNSVSRATKQMDERMPNAVRGIEQIGRAAQQAEGAVQKLANSANNLHGPRPGAAGGGGGGRSNRGSHGGHGGGFNIAGMLAGANEFAFAAMGAEMMTEMMAGTLKPAMDFQHRSNGLAMAGFTADQVKAAQQQAFDVNRAFPGIGASEALQTIREGASIFASPKEGIKLAPVIAQLESSLMAAGSETPFSGKEHELANSIVKAAEQAGFVGDEKQFKKFSEFALKENIISGGKVTPSMIQSAIGMMGGAKFGMDFENMMPVIGHYLQEASTGKGGGSRGVGPLFYQQWKTLVGGTMTKGATGEMMRLGLLGDPNNPATRELVGKGLAIANPHEWVQQVFRKAVDRAVPGFEDMTKTDQSKALTGIVGSFNKNTSRFLMEEMLNRGNIDKQIAQYHNLPGMDALSKQGGKDVGLQLRGVEKSWETMIAKLGSSPAIMGAVSKSLDGITHTIHLLDSAVTGGTKAIDGFQKSIPALTKLISQLFSTIGSALNTILKMAGSASHFWEGAAAGLEKVATIRNSHDIMPHLNEAAKDFYKGTKQTLSEDWGHFAEHMDRSTPNFIKSRFHGWNNVPTVPAPPGGVLAMARGVKHATGIDIDKLQDSHPTYKAPQEHFDLYAPFVAPKKERKSPSHHHGDGTHHSGHGSTVIVNQYFQPMSGMDSDKAAKKAAEAIKPHLDKMHTRDARQFSAANMTGGGSYQARSFSKAGI